ncbi:MAG: class II fructose-bisphosphate aldolase, partial [Cyclobacteriaceae bacterium]
KLRKSLSNDKMILTEKLKELTDHKSGILATNFYNLETLYGIDYGICKVNLATEIKEIFMITLQGCLNGNHEIDLRKVFPTAINAVSELVSNKLEVVRNKKSNP